MHGGILYFETGRELRSVGVELQMVLGKMTIFGNYVLPSSFTSALISGQYKINCCVKFLSFTPFYVLEDWYVTR